MNLTPRIVFPLLLLGFWLYMAYRAFSHGDTGLALVYLGVGAVLAMWRLHSAKA